MGKKVNKTKNQNKTKNPGWMGVKIALHCIIIERGRGTPADKVNKT